MSSVYIATAEIQDDETPNASPFTLSLMAEVWGPNEIFMLAHADLKARGYTLKNFVSTDIWEHVRLDPRYNREKYDEVYRRVKNHSGLIWLDEPE